jgi:predicted enzyme related to lactoylglutathione lyase
MIRVDDVEAAARYYTQVFGLHPQWSGDGSIGLVFPESDAEVVLHSDPDIPSSVEVHYFVDDVVAAVAHYEAQGCQILVTPFDITIGKCAVIKDPFGTRLCILDMTKGSRPLNLTSLTSEGSDVMN